MCVSGMVDWSDRMRCRGKGLSYQVEPASVLQGPLCFQASIAHWQKTLRSSFKTLAIFWNWDGERLSNTHAQSVTPPNLEWCTKMRQMLLSQCGSKVERWDWESCGRKKQERETNNQRPFLMNLSASKKQTERETPRVHPTGGICSERTLCWMKYLRYVMHE